MDLYKISYDIGRPDIDQLTINKDSRFAIQLELIQPKNYEVRAVDDTTRGDYPVLIIKKSDGSEDDYYYTDLTIDEHFDNNINTYIWKIDKFNQDISCCIDIYAYYYNEETEEENEYRYPSVCVCKVASKDSSVANDAVTYNEYDYNTGIKIGKDSVMYDDSIAIGKEAYAEDNGIAIGISSQGAGVDSIAIGKNASTGSDNAILIGKDARVSYSSPNSIAIGASAKIEHDLADKIQLGAGMLSAKNILVQVKDFPLLKTDGEIYYKRIGSTQWAEIFEEIDENTIGWGLGTDGNPIENISMIDKETGEIYNVYLRNGQFVIA